MAKGLSLNLSGLQVTSDDDRLLLDIPSFCVAPGASLGIRGPSGAGKSTLLFAIAGLQRRVSGRIAWGETDLATASTAARARFRAKNMGFVFQDFLLFEEMSAIDNAALSAMFAPRHGRAGLRAEAADRLRRLGLGDLDRDVATFSGGERQRVAVARALTQGPAILLADEPTASLDRAAADALITDLLATTHRKDRTLVAVSHDSRLLDAMDRVLTLEDGRVVGDVSQ